MSQQQNQKLDKIKGMIYGVSLGDALGLPYEFYTITPKIPYTGKIYNQKLTIQFQFVSLEIPPASFTDDTEMSIVLLKHLIQNNLKIQKDKLILEYMNWANIAKMLGKNTRALLKGIKTLKGYNNRISKLTPEQKASAQSNGSLMRASPLVLTSTEDAILDTNITNDNQINRDATLIYQQILKLLLDNKLKKEVMDYVKNLENDQKISETVRTVIKSSFTDEVKNIGKPLKGWVLSSLYISLKTFWKYDNFESAMEYIITKFPGSDTDTNGAICGALFGCYLGYGRLETTQKENIGVIDKCFLKNGVDQETWKNLEKLL